jgi:DnaK suppressor protein
MATTNRRPKLRARYAGLKRILEERRRQIQCDVHDKIHDVRDQGTWGGHLHEVLDDVEVSDADVQEDIELAVIQLKTEMLGKIDEALDRLRDGDYGFCFECGEEISEKRLRALPFAVRCRPCEESHEAAQAPRARQLPHRGYRGEVLVAPLAV